MYCKYAVLRRSSNPAPDRVGPSRSSKSTSTTDGADAPDCDLTYSATVPATGDVVRMTDGDASPSTELTRSSLTPPSGPKAEPRSVPPALCRETQQCSQAPVVPISARSPVEPHRRSASATFSFRRYSCDQVRLSATPAQSYSQSINVNTVSSGCRLARSRSKAKIEDPNHAHQLTVAIAAASSERTAKFVPIFQPPSRQEVVGQFDRR